METIKIVFAGGGTGGHFYPALAIANRMVELANERKIKMEIVFAGTKRGIEYRMKDSYDYSLFMVNIRGISRSLTLKNLVVPFLALSALFKSYRYLKSFSPDLIIGTGGYVSWPLLKAGVMRKITVLLQEQNSFPGLVTRKIAGSAKRVYLGYKKAEDYLPEGTNCLVTGNPVRGDLNKISREEALEKLKMDASKTTILILGGSQGARAINEAVLKDLETGVLSDKNNYQLLWQTGKRDYKDVVAKAGKKVSCSLYPFVENIEDFYAAADIVIARAGALTLAELEASLLPSILIPFPSAAGDHQRKNALFVQECGFAKMIEEKELAQKNIIREAIGLYESGEAKMMKEKLTASSADRKPAVDLICEDIFEILKNSKEEKADCAG